MKIVQALKKNTMQDIASKNFFLKNSQNDQTIDSEVYKSNLIAVNSYVTSVLESSLPTLHKQPANWKLFTQTYLEAESDALTWVNTVLARLDSVPEDVQTYYSDINYIFLDAIDMTKCMINYPARRTMYAGLLNQDLSLINSKLKLVNSFIQGTVDALTNFQNILPEMAEKLQTIADLSAKEEGVDLDEIDSLKRDVKKLNNDIAQLTATIVALGIADASAIAIGTLATIVAFPLGAFTWLFAGPAVIAASVCIALDAEKIKDDQTNIKKAQNNMDELTQDVASLHLLAQNYKQLSDSSEAIQVNLNEILTVWVLLSNDMNNAIEETQKAVNDAQTCNDLEILEDLTQASKYWEQAYSDAGDLEITLSHNDGNFEIGMTQEQVQKAADNGNVVDIVSYFNDQSQAGKRLAKSKKEESKSILEPIA